jgi:hypothetical protein
MVTPEAYQHCSLVAERDMFDCLSSVCRAEATRVDASSRSSLLCYEQGWQRRHCLSTVLHEFLPKRVLDWVQASTLLRSACNVHGAHHRVKRIHTCAS